MWYLKYRCKLYVIRSLRRQRTENCEKAHRRSKCYHTHVIYCTHCNYKVSVIRRVTIVIIYTLSTVPTVVTGVILFHAAMTSLLGTEQIINTTALICTLYSLVFVPTRVCHFCIHLTALVVPSDIVI